MFSLTELVRVATEVEFEQVVVFAGTEIIGAAHAANPSRKQNTAEFVTLGAALFIVSSKTELLRVGEYWEDAGPKEAVFAGTELGAFA